MPESGEQGGRQQQDVGACVQYGCRVDRHDDDGRDDGRDDGLDDGRNDGHEGHDGTRRRRPRSRQLEAWACSTGREG